MAIQRREALILGGIGLGAGLAGTLAGVLALQASSGAAQLLSAPFRDLDGQPRRLLDWRGRALLCNFWATWCAPCRDEVPLLVAAKQQIVPGKVEIVGIGIDSADKIREFASTYRITYPLVVGDATTITLLRRLGNRTGGLPFTVLLDAQGAIVHRHLGALSGADLRKVLGSLIG